MKEFSEEAVVSKVSWQLFKHYSPVFRFAEIWSDQIATVSSNTACDCHFESSC